MAIIYRSSNSFGFRRDVGDLRRWRAGLRARRWLPAGGLCGPGPTHPLDHGTGGCCRRRQAGGPGRVRAGVQVHQRPSRAACSSRAVCAPRGLNISNASSSRQTPPAASQISVRALGLPAAAAPGSVSSPTVRENVVTRSAIVPLGPAPSPPVGLLPLARGSPPPSPRPVPRPPASGTGRYPRRPNPPASSGARPPTRPARTPPRTSRCSRTARPVAWPEPASAPPPAALEAPAPAQSATEARYGSPGTAGRSRHRPRRVRVPSGPRRRCRPAPTGRSGDRWRPPGRPPAPGT